jgi:hypothetical protein
MPLYKFLQNLLNALVQTANKMGSQKKPFSAANNNTCSLEISTQFESLSNTALRM